MSDERLNLAVILASVRQRRFGPVVANWFSSEARRHGEFDVTLIDLAEAPLPPVLGPEPPAIATNDARPAEMALLTQQLESADAFVIVTPEYNRSYPASIKTLIDWHFTEWRTKPVGFVSYGGPAGGLRAVEHLRLVLAELHAVTMRHTVSFTKYWELFDDKGEPNKPETLEESAALLKELAWWARVLRDARISRPYAVAA
jgi:NAD(P)H-dependent FMN reductase